MGYAFVGGEGKHVVQFKVNGFASAGWLHIKRGSSFETKRRRFGIIPGRSLVRSGCPYWAPVREPTGSSAADTGFSDFIRLYPEDIVDYSAVGRVFLQVQIPQEDLGAMLILNEGDGFLRPARRRVGGARY